QATEAIVDVSLNVDSIDPIIKELLQRVRNMQNKSQNRKNSLTSAENSVDNSNHSGNVKIEKGHSSSKTGKSKSQDRRDSTGEKKFRCAKCSLEFSRSSDLRRHEKTHFAILPNICPQCGKGFARKDALKRHYDTLTCRRNRTKLLTAGGESINELLKKVKQSNIVNRQENNNNSTNG
ncbi:Met32p, partial [Saccharomyces cerevisiae x Saccharomyces kudriavzevii VIN7]